MLPVLLELPDLDSFSRQGACFGISRNMLLVGWGKVSQNAIASSEDTTFYSNDFFLSHSRPWFRYEYNALIARTNLNRQVGKPGPLHRTWSCPDWSRFGSMFHQAQAAIARGDLIKAVPILQCRGERGISKIELRSMLGHVLQLSPGLTPYGMWSPEGGILGASPELLFSASGKEIRSIALAGTARHNEKHNPLTDPKERMEHQIVVEFLLKQFSLLGPVKIGETQISNFGNISHLMTPLWGHADKPFSFSELVVLLHPTPALGVAPQDRWREWAPTLGHEKGNLFAAPFGASLPSQTLKCIAGIRGVQWSQNEVHFAAGCGVINDSQLESEKNEISHKLSSIMQNLGIAR